MFSVVSHLQGISLNQTDLDVKGIAFERFLGNFFKGEIGQFFTPREVVEFMVDMVTPHHENLILDPACGSGGFLLHAMDYIRKQASDFYTEGTPQHYTHWHDFAEKRLFGIEVNDSIARVAKMNMIIHDDGHSNVISNDALVGFDTLYNQHRGFEKERFDVILTNPPFGAVIKQSELPYLENYELGRGNASQKTEILFLERCFDFLKWGTGKLAIILPDGILTNSSLQYVRDYIERHFQILAVVSLPQIAFSHYGAGVKTSILFLRKFSEQEYDHYQAAINQITDRNQAIYTPKITALENERKSLIAKGSPAQVDVTETYRQQFISILDSIDALNQKLDKTPTKKVQTLSAFFFPDIDSTPTTEFESFNAQTARVELKAQMSKLNALEKEYKVAFKAAADPDWENQIKAESKEQIDAVKEEWTDKNAEDIREWVKENADHPIFMAIAERIGYDATGRKDEINDLNTICEEYRKFTENPDFFRVSPDRENQIFLTYRGDILGRFDPSAYRSLRTNSINAIKSSKYQSIDLKDVVEFRKEIVIDSSELPYVGLENIQSNTGFYVPSTGEKESFNSALKFEVGDILFPKLRPYLNKVHLAQFKGVCSTEFHVLKVKDLNNLYLSTFLSSELVVDQTTCLMTGNTLPRLQPKDVQRLPILVPPSNIQNHIASFMRSAYAQKKQKEQQADALLDSIDDYVLTELGIEIPHQKDNNIQNRIFTTMSGAVSGQRFDPEIYYRVYSLHTKSYPMERLQNCVFINPTTSFHGYELDTSVTFIPMEKVSAKYGETDLSLCKVVAEAKGYTRFRDDDLIWAKITPCMENGKSAVVDNLKAGIGCGSTEFHVFRALEGINIHYIHALLRLRSLREHAALHFTGSAGQQRVSSEFFKDLIIPKPPIEKQTEIADYITKSRNRAKQLQHEADAIVEKAKERAEQILLAEV